MGEQNFWLIEIYSDDTANVSITSQEEVEALESMGEIEDWMFAPVNEADEEDMIERAEENGYEHDPW
ncbi:MAG: hypothetical protein ABEI58_03920 [Candidatus Nanohaloarchaea archaeon]